MKLKKIFALALAVCMMVSVMPTTLAVDGVLTSGGTSGSGDGVLTSGGGSSSLTLTSGGSTVSRVTSGAAQTRQDGVLYSTGSGSEGGTTPVADPVVDTSGALDGGEKAAEGSTAGIYTKLENTSSSSGSADLATDAKNGLEMTKTVSEDGDKITLEAWVTGEEVTVTVKEGEPVEIVLVLDRSARMLVTAENGKTKMENLKSAATGFLTAVQDKSPKSRVAIVSYANENASTVDSGTKTEKVGALVPITTINENTQSEEVNPDLIDTIEGLTANGDAYSDEALGKTTRILQDLTVQEPNNDNKRIVILFTAGIPGQGSWTRNDNAYSIAQESIHWSTILKANKTNTLSIGSGGQYDVDLSQQFYSYYSRTNANVFNTVEKGCSAHIFCVGIDLVTNTGSSSDGAKINEYLYRVSSHRRDGSHVGDVTDLGILGKYDGRDIQNAWEELHEDWSYNYPDIYTRGNIENSAVTGTKYYQAGDIEDVGSMFEEISNDITTGGSSNETLTTATVVQDVISQYFQIPADGTVTAYSVAYNGKDSAGNLIWAESATATYTPDVQDNKVTVNGFNFSDNWVGTSSGKNHGQKLVIEIDIEPKTGFLGGQNIPTNDDANAGIYLNGTLVENFPATDAKTNVEIPAITVDVQDKNVYLSNEMTVAEMLADAVVKIGDTTLNLKAENFGLTAWQYAYLSKIEVVSTENDGSFKATCTVTDKAANTKNGDDSASVNVFKPHITFKDSTIYLGEKADYSENNGSPLVVWKNGQTSSDDVTMTGNKPSVDVDYSIEEQEKLYFTGCTDISITKVSLNEDEKDYKANTTFWNGDEKTDDVQFTVHVVKPEFETSNATIYLSNEINLNDLMQVKEDWVCDSECTDKQSLKNADVPNTITIDHSFSVNDEAVADELAPEDCATYTVTTTVNRLHVQSNAQVKVHVVKPEITNADTAIYLGNTVDLNTLVTEEGDTWTCDETGEDNVSLDIYTSGGVRIAPAVDHSFDGVDAEDEGNFAPDTCTTLSVTTKVGNYAVAPVDNDNNFTVHVHVPQFTVTARDLWADFNDTVYLYNNTDSDAIVSHVNTWVDREGHNNELEVSGAKEVVITDILFSEDDSYTMGETDVDVDVIKVKSTVNGVAYTAVKADSTENYDKQLTVVKAVAEEDHDFTIHINKFKAVITNNGEQNAIYTLSNGTKVAVPAKGSVTVAGLICGKEYTISEDEDNAWTWRYEDAATENYGNGKENISCVVGVKSEATNSSVDVSMDYGAQSNAKWLAGEDCVVNKLNANGKAVVALPAKKEEEVNA